MSASLLFGFLYFENLVYPRAGDLLADSGWPENFDICVRGHPETKMQPFVTGREITSGRSGEPDLPVNLHARTQPIAVASGTAKADGNPVIPTCLVHEHLRRASEHGHDHVDVAIIVNIAKRGPASGERSIRTRIDLFEAPAVVQ